MSTPRKRRRKGQLGPTQKDIADALGFSQSTVAMALSPLYENRLLEETAQRIKQYAEEIGYHPQRFAQIMQGGQTKVIGIVLRLGPQGLISTFVSQFANEFTRLGYRIVVVDPSWFDGDTEGVKRYLLDQGVEGVIICNIVTAESNEIASKLPKKLPLIGFQSVLKEAPNFYMDPLTAFYDITRVHMALGAKRISLLLSFRDAGHIATTSFTTITRAAGFVKAISEGGGDVIANRTVAELINQPQLIEQSSGNDLEGEIIYTVRRPGITSIQQHGYQETTCLIKSGNLPDALLCANDDLAISALAALTDHGISVPGEVLLSGYDDTVGSRFTAIPLTSVRPRLEEAITAAVKRLISMIEEPETNPRKPGNTLFYNDIVLRHSSGSPETLAALVENASPEISGDIILEKPRSNKLLTMIK